MDATTLEAAAVERMKMGVRAETFLGTLTGAFISTWERPEELHKALLELTVSQPGVNARTLLSYLEVLRSPLVKMVEAAEGEGHANQWEQSLKRQKQGEDGGSSRAGKALKGHTAAGAAATGILATLESAATRVLSDRDLVATIFGKLEGGPDTVKQRVRMLSHMGGVCRMWRGWAASDQWWVGAEELLPAVWKEQARDKPHVARQRVLDHGRMLVRERSVWRDDDWTQGLELHFEVFDRMDRLHMLSVSGPLAFDVNDVLNFNELLIPAGPRVEVRGSAFSAASRDPEHNRFEDIRDFFSRCHLPEFPCSLCVRVMVKDTRTGRMALLWEENKEAEWDWDVSPNYQVAHDRRLQGTVLYRSADAPLLSLHPSGEDLRCHVNFHLIDVPQELAGEEGGAAQQQQQQGQPQGQLLDDGEEEEEEEEGGEDLEQQELWRLVGGEENYEDHASPISFLVDNPDASMIGRLIRSLLKCPTGEGGTFM